MADVKWIKIVTDIFDDEKIILIESMPEKYAIITAWFKLLCLAGKQNNHGIFLLNDKIPYTDEMIATIFRMELNTVRLALNTFEEFGMIERVENVITIPNWEKHQQVEGLDKIREQTRQRVRNYRERQKLLVENLSGSVTEPLLVTESNDTDIEEEKELETEEEHIKKRGGVFQQFAGDDKELSEMLKEYNDYRKRKHKPLTDNAKERFCKKLEKYPREQWIPLIQQTIDRGWSDIYPLEEPPKAIQGKNFKVSSDPNKWESDTKFNSAIADLMNG